ncbi:ImmA/IrrE family metallo-endopeptidase [Microbacterium sp. NPDC058021]|uniref:ImmA/IrrE family metallo-endopeptidase n=1 Tax=Microbacterium sp. NPDC058021 TaxID=3346306 RepID=UPI0036DDABB4
MSHQRSSLGSAEAKLERLHAKLADAVARLVTGDDWARALEFATRFRSRSFNNTVLIRTQHSAASGQGRVPELTPTYIAGFTQWRALGRSVDRGQVGGHGYSLRIVGSDRDLGGANGMTDYVTRCVAVRGDMDPAARAKTLAHELAHLKLHGPTGQTAGRRSSGQSETSPRVL